MNLYADSSFIVANRVRHDTFHRVALQLANAFVRSCPGTDLLHVANAKEFGADLFVSFDDEQLLLAQAVGLKAVNPLNRSALSD